MKKEDSSLGFQELFLEESKEEKILPMKAKKRNVQIKKNKTLFLNPELSTKRTHAEKGRTTPFFEMGDAEPPLKILGNERVDFKEVGLTKIQQNILKGKLRAELSLDLHGYSFAEASSSLEAFWKRCYNEKIRSIEIIHGKGCPKEGSPLKGLCKKWLESRKKETLAYQSLQDARGGFGAIRIILRRTQKD